MDHRLIPAALGAGWLLLTLGIWGACSLRWWIWPLSAGVALLALGLAYGWAMTVRPPAAEGEGQP